jgi:hypothetical protein
MNALAGHKTRGFEKYRPDARKKLSFRIPGENRLSK